MKLAAPRRPPKRIKDILSPLMAHMTVTHRPSADEVAVLWRKLVGGKAAQHSQPTSLKRGELLVTVDASVWLWNLSLQREELLKGLRAAWGSEAVSVIRLRLRPSA